MSLARVVVERRYQYVGATCGLSQCRKRCPTDVAENWLKCFQLAFRRELWEDAAQLMNSAFDGMSNGVESMENAIPRRHRLVKLDDFRQWLVCKQATEHDAAAGVDRDKREVS